VFVGKRVGDMNQERSIRKVGKVAQQATAVFADAEIIAVRSADDGLIYASLPHLCRALGLDIASQEERIEEHAVLTEGLCDFDLVIGDRVLTTSCLKSNLVALWLALVPVKRLKREKQARVLLFQRKAADALDRLFGPGPRSDAGETTTALVPASPQEAAYAEGLAIARMANEQAQLASQKAEAVETKVTAFEEAVEARLLALEARLMPRGQITEEQAERISDLVKQAAIALLKQSGGGNYFGTLYGQLYRMCGITSYKLMTQGQYPKAVTWLEKMIRENQ
jgi:P22_AR N-terminal domain